MSDQIEILNQVKQNLKAVLGNRIQKVILFGSHLRLITDALKAGVYAD